MDRCKFKYFKNGIRRDIGVISRLGGRIVVARKFDVVDVSELLGCRVDPLGMRVCKRYEIENSRFL